MEMKATAIEFIENPYITSRRRCSSLLGNLDDENEKRALYNNCEEAFAFQHLIDIVDYHLQSKFCML